jgi:hypothetical protein
VRERVHTERPVFGLLTGIIGGRNSEVLGGKFPLTGLDKTLRAPKSVAVQIALNTCQERLQPKNLGRATPHYRHRRNLRQLALKPESEKIWLGGNSPLPQHNRAWLCIYYTHTHRAALIQK